MDKYYKNENWEYNFLHTDESWIYEDVIVKPSDEGLGSDLLSPNVKAYLDELVGRILVDNQVQEER
ncbi:hypothetical protein RYX36_012251 [Vicia faba]